MKEGIYKYNTTWTRTTGINIVRISNDISDIEEVAYVGGGEYRTLDNSWRVSVLDPKPVFVREFTDSEKMLFRLDEKSIEENKKMDEGWLKDGFIDTSEYNED